MNKWMLAITLAISFFATGVSAAGAGTSPIAEILRYTTSPLTYVRMQTTPTGSPACHTHANYHFVLTVAGEEGKSTYAALLAAYVSGKPVQVYGKNVCDLQNNVETLAAAGVK